jgi:N-acetylglucosaminyl-diphospho-decaprenol L-rhamnosyltransferase
VAAELSILIVTYECRDWAQKCLQSIYATSGDVELEVIVLDNASRDGTVAMIRAEFPEATVIESCENIGFARGVNQAALRASGEYVLLLNPDTAVHSGSLSSMIEFARRHPAHGLYGGRTLRPDGTVDPSSCWGLPTAWSLVCFGFMLTTLFKRSRLLDPESLGRWDRDTVREVGIVTGCLLLVPRRIWEDLGGFDERFFMYGEDADLAIRARKKGYRPVITPEAVVTHEVGASSGTRPDKLVLLLRGRSTLLRKHWPRGRRVFGLTMLQLGVLLRGLLSSVLARGRHGDAAAWWPVWTARKEWLPGYPPASGARGAASSAGLEAGGA